MSARIVRPVRLLLTLALAVSALAGTFAVTAPAAHADNPTAGTDEGWVATGHDQVIRMVDGTDPDLPVTSAAVKSNGYGFLTNADAFLRQGYVIQLMDSPGINRYRTATITAANAISARGGIPVHVQQGIAPYTTGYTKGIIRVQVAADSPCGSLRSGIVGCGGYSGAWVDGKLEIWGGNVWLSDRLVNWSSSVQTSTVLHELGHAFGLNHYEPAYAGTRQIMYPMVEDGRHSYQHGDLAGFSHLKPLPLPLEQPSFYSNPTLSGGSARQVIAFGGDGDIGLVCNFDGKGGDGPVVFRGGRWYYRHSADSGTASGSFSFGRGGDQPLCADVDGDGADEPFVVRGRTWYGRYSASGGPGQIVFTYGVATDTPVLGDWNGDGRATPGVYRNAYWYLRDHLNGGTAQHSFRYGTYGDQPIVGDWDGDGRDGIGIVRGNAFHLRHTATGGGGQVSFSFGRTSDRGGAADFDGDGRDGPALLRRLG